MTLLNLKKYILGVSLMVCLALPTAPRAQVSMIEAIMAADAHDFIVVTFERDFIERIVEESIQAQVVNEIDNLYWGHIHGRRVEVSKKNATHIRVDLDLAYSLPSIIPNPEVDVDFEIGFNCFWRQPEVNLSLPYFDVDIDFPWYVDVGSLGFSWVASFLGDAIIDRKLASLNKIKGDLIAELNDSIDLPLDECPAFNVTDTGDVQLLFGQGNECTLGDTRHSQCPYRHYGPGWDEQCINGYWEKAGGWCEPSPPPGGHPL